MTEFTWILSMFKEIITVLEAHDELLDFHTYWLAGVNIIQWLTIIWACLHVKKGK